ncbi:chloroperoxidase [Singulisphaera sp. Ch08]|uniref:Chloroperoxidase n=1 Tax=Singulisphaera sp. Ch08 TaxID=3120278 RepID=A0AAU7CP78_9BACT
MGQARKAYAMRIHLNSIVGLLVVIACSLSGWSKFSTSTSWAGDGNTNRSGTMNHDRGNRDWSNDAVLDWNAVLLQACANDYDPAVVSPPDQRGPERTARAFAIVHVAIFDAVNSVDGSFTPYLAAIKAAPGASIDAAVAQAGHDTLIALYPHQKALFDSALAQSLDGIPSWQSRRGVEVGKASAANILAARANDGSMESMSYTPIRLPGYHRVDPLHPTQGYLNPMWGRVIPFTMTSSEQFLAPDFVGENPVSRFAWLNSDEYTAAFLEVKAFGAKNSSVRTADQTEIGIFWSYDGSPRLGTPPRLYNQIARVIANQMDNSEVENARLFALINLAMGDAGISCWYCKYEYQFWRPIIGIRNAASTGNPATVADRNWEPLGAQADNGSGTNFTPSFPSYTSGHASFGSALFQVLRRYYGTDEIPFRFQSDEFNGVTQDDTGKVRPRRTRCYFNMTQAEKENHDSRIYLGVHWRFDQHWGLVEGQALGNFVIDNYLLPR